MDENFISIEQAAEITGLSAGVLAQLRYHGGGPTFYKPTPRVVRYRASEVIAWLESTAHQRTDTPALAR